MIKLDDFKKNNILINWKLINIGCLGSETFFKELDYEEITNYAISIFDEKNKNILRILSYNKDEYEEMGEFIKELAIQENSDEKIAYKKWELIYIIKNLPPKRIDYIQGIIELQDIWAKIDFPKDSPLILQGLNNDISPEEFYTENNYLILYNLHMDWIKEKIDFLKGK